MTPIESKTNDEVCVAPTYDELYAAYEVAWKDWHKVIDDLEYELKHNIDFRHTRGEISNSQRKKLKADVFNKLRDYKENVRPPKVPVNPNKPKMPSYAARMLPLMLLASKNIREY